MSQSLEATDALGAAGAVAPRISLKWMESQIEAKHFMLAGDAIAALSQPTLPGSPLDRLTICLLVMRNGFAVIGKSAPMSAENFDPEKGRTFAYEDAIRQLWPLYAFARLEAAT